MGRQHFSINSGRIAITDNPVSVNFCAILYAHTNDPLALNQYLLDIGIQLDINALPAHQRFEFRDQLARAAHTKIDPPFAFQIMDQRIDRGGIKRIAAYQQGMDRKSLLQKRMFDMAINQLCNRHIALQAQ